MHQMAQGEKPGGLKIVRGIPGGKRNEVASLTYSTDPGVFRAVFGKEASKILERALNDKMVFVAMVGSEIIGAMGIASKDEKSLNVTSRIIREVRGFKFLKSLLLWQFIKSMPEEGELFVEFMAVKPQYRGMGVGTALLRKAIDFAREGGFTRVRLFVRAENTSAKRLYEKLGFVVEKPIRVPFPLNRLLSVEKGYRMVLNLRGFPTGGLSVSAKTF